MQLSDILVKLEKAGTAAAYHEAMEFIQTGEFFWGKECPRHLATCARQIPDLIPGDTGINGEPVGVNKVMRATYGGVRGCFAGERRELLTWPEKEFLRGLAEKYASAIHYRLPMEGYPVFDLIYDDLGTCVLSRACFGPDSQRFYERVFLVYQSGGMPCGYTDFEGWYPDGRPKSIPKLLAWYPGIPMLKDRGKPAMSYPEWLDSIEIPDPPDFR